MGMYTELIFGAALKSDTPKEVIETLQYMSGYTEEKPEQYLWNEDLRNPLQGGSSYFAIDKPVTKMYHDGYRWVLSSRSNIKNYNDEIETFLKWIKPFIGDGSGLREMYAIVIHEEWEEPEIYFSL
ncbi:hypothetical protein CMU81_00955 [Elizabethkingia anophelis]|nr:hypothetical protein [Elizabethkingia anophelis]MDV4025715.1 hypothetical protein [Elizabethkingia anophelis]